MSSRSLPSSALAGDTGLADERLSAALAAQQADPARRPGVLAALHETRVLVPVVATLGAAETGADGLRREKSSDVSVPLLTGEDGRRALAVFSSVQTMGGWDPAARPVPVGGRDAARLALTEADGLLAVDVAGPRPCVLYEAEVQALADGRGRRPAYDDEGLAAAVAAALAAEPLVVAARIRPAAGCDAGVDVTVGADDDEELRALATRLSHLLQQLPEVRAASVRGLDLAVRPKWLVP